MDWRRSGVIGGSELTGVFCRLLVLVSPVSGLGWFVPGTLALHSIAAIWRLNFMMGLWFLESLFLHWGRLNWFWVFLYLFHCFVAVVPHAFFTRCDLFKLVRIRVVCGG